MDDLSLDSICGVRLYQRRNGYRFSMDSVLLAGFAVLTRRMKRVVDLGAGSGVVGLILAKRYPWTEVLLVEIQEGLLDLAAKNVGLNGLQRRARVLRADMSSPPRDLAEGFDAVVSNPPFRRPGTGRISPSDEKALARHEVRLTLTDFARTTSMLLKNKGRLFLVYHPFRLAEAIQAMREHRLEPRRLRFVHPDAGSGASMVLVEAVKDGGVELKVEPPLFIRGRDGTFTEEMEALYSP